MSAIGHSCAALIRHTCKQTIRHTDLPPPHRLFSHYKEQPEIKASITPLLPIAISYIPHIPHEIAIPSPNPL